jgi:hypothetical protein
LSRSRAIISFCIAKVMAIIAPNPRENKRGDDADLKAAPNQRAERARNRNIGER